MGYSWKNNWDVVFRESKKGGVGSLGFRTIRVEKGWDWPDVGTWAGESPSFFLRVG